MRAAEQKKGILAVSLEDRRKFLMQAMSEHQTVGVSNCYPLSGTISQWEPFLREQVEKCLAKGFVVLVEDRSGRFVGNATQFSFDQVLEDGRTMFQHCLDWYFSLYDLGGLLLHPSVARFSFQCGKASEESIITRSVDDKGRPLYSPTWEKITGGHKALLMCIAGAMLEEPYSERYVRVLGELWGVRDREPFRGPWDSFQAITRGADRARAAAHETAVAERQARIEAWKAGRC